MQKLLLSLLFFSLASVNAYAQPEDYKGIVAEEKWSVLHLRRKPNPRPLPFPATCKLISLKEFQITGPMPGHPFVLGNFAADGEWGMVNGYIQPLSGKNSVFEFGWADQFELEGIAEHGELGGWFLLCGWDDGRGHGIINCTLKDSGSPWFVSRFRGSRAVPDGTEELPGFAWKGEQPFLLTVKENQLSLTVGKFKVIENKPLEGYVPGRIVFGVYDTRYGPKPVRIKSVRLKSLPATESVTPEQSEN